MYSDLSTKYSIIGQLSIPLGTKMLVRCKTIEKTTRQGNTLVSVIRVNGVKQTLPVKLDAKYHHAIKEVLLLDREYDIECYESGEYIGSPYLVRDPATGISISRESYRFVTFIVITRIANNP